MTIRLSGLRRGIAGAAFLLAASIPAFAADAPLPSWNATPTRDAIIAYVTRITTPGSPQFVDPGARLAVFDNDGTLWSEQPLYVQLFYVIDRVKELAPLHPEWQTQEPFASVLKGDIKGALSGGYDALMALSAATQSGMTTTAYIDGVENWIATAKNPVKDRRFLDMTYQPMLELLAYLRANEFKVFIVSGGGMDFMRAFTEPAYGVEPENVVGSTGALKFQIVDGDPVIMKEPAVTFVDDGPGKPVGIETHIGRKPIFAFGNSDGDIQMLQYTCVDPSVTFCALVHHTDGVREFAYDRNSSMGRLDKGLDAAAANGWTLVDMAKDWSVVYPPAK